MLDLLLIGVAVVPVIKKDSVPIALAKKAKYYILCLAANHYNRLLKIG
jgi:hypothetical protein